MPPKSSKRKNVGAEPGPAAAAPEPMQVDQTVPVESPPEPVCPSCSQPLPKTQLPGGITHAAAEKIILTAGCPQEIVAATNIEAIRARAQECVNNLENLVERDWYGGTTC